MAFQSAIVVSAIFISIGRAAEERKPPAEGPRMTDEELFNSLNLALPGLDDARKAVEAKDMPAARRALAAYLRNRKPARWYYDPREIDRNISHNGGAADKTVAGKICVISIWHEFPDGKIDWFYNPTTARPGLAMDCEWQWQLNRMGFWGELGRTYWATGDEKYAAAFVDHLRSWARQCPRPDSSGNTYPSPWRTIESGIRMGYSWFDAFNRFLLSPSFTDDDVCLFVKLCLEHSVHLRKHPTTGNWLTMEMNGLYTVGAVFPEFKDAAEWRGFAISSLHEELNRQFLPDGAQVELTPGYHQVALQNVLALPQKARIMDLQDEIPPDYVTLTERAFEYNLYLMTPDRDLPRFNDSWHVNVRSSCANAVELFPKRDDFRWIATDGKEGKQPAGTSHAFPYAGYYVMRSGWETDANYLCFDAGPLGYGHVHQDKLNLVIWSYGRQTLFDSGGGSYERSKYRSYGTDTFSHNTVLVDGKPQRRGSKNRWDNVSTVPLKVRFDTTSAWDYCIGKYEEGYGDAGYRPASHIRQVLFIKPDMFLTVDTLTPADDREHDYQARWHLLTTSTSHDSASGVVVSADKNAPNLAVVPLMTEGLEVRCVSAQTEPELLGWHLEKDKETQYVPATTVTHSIKGAGVKRLLTMLLPLKAGAQPILAKSGKHDGREFNARFDDGRLLRITLDDDPAGDIAIAETLGDGSPGRSFITNQPK